MRTCCCFPCKNILRRMKDLKKKKARLLEETHTLQGYKKIYMFKWFLNYEESHNPEGVLLWPQHQPKLDLHSWKAFHSVNHSTDIYETPALCQALFRQQAVGSIDLTPALMKLRVTWEGVEINHDYTVVQVKEQTAEACLSGDIQRPSQSEGFTRQPGSQGQGGELWQAGDIVSHPVQRLGDQRESGKEEKLRELCSQIRTRREKDPTDSRKGWRCTNPLWRGR